MAKKQKTDKNMVVTYIGECGQEINVSYYKIQNYCNKCNKIHLFEVKD